MKKSDFRKALLAGSAIVAVSGLMLNPSPAHAAGEFAVDTNDSNDAIYETDVNTGTNWGANDGHDLRVDDSGTLLISDGATFGDGDADQAAITPAVTGKTLTLSDQGDNDADANVDVDGDIDVGALAAMNLIINGDGVGAAGDGGDLSFFDFNGDIDLGTGTLTIAADQDTAGSDVTVLVDGDVTSGGITLNAAAGGSDATVKFDGAAAQLIASDINGADTGEGNLLVTGTGPVTFTGDVGATKTVDLISINNDGNNVSVTFKGDVKTANGLTFGDNSGTDTNTVTFDSTAGSIAVAGAVDGGGAADTNNIVIAGTNTVTFAGAVGAGSKVDTITLSSTGTADFDADVKGALVFSAGGTMKFADGLTITGTIDNKSTAGVGTITFEDTGGGTTVTGAIGATAAVGTINVQGAGGAVTFDGAVTATTTNVGATSTADFNQNATTNVRFTGDGDIDLAAGKTLTGSIDNVVGAANKGTVTLQTTGGTTTVTGLIGTTAALDLVEITGTGTAALSSAVAAEDINITGASTVNFGGSVTSVNGIDLNNNNATVTFADDANLTGNILSSGGANGILNFTGDSTVTGQIGLAGGTAISAVNINGNGSTVSVSGNSFVGALTTLTGATVRLNGNTTASGAITNGGTVYIAAGKTLTAGSFAGAGTYSLAVEDDGDNTLNAADFGSLASGGAINLAAETVHFVYTGNVAEGADIILGTGGAAAVTATTVTDNSLIFNSALAANGNNLELTVTRNDISSFTNEPNAIAVGAVLDSLAASTDEGLGEILDAVAAASDVEELAEVLEAASPTVDGGAVAAGVNAVTVTSGITNTRLAALRDGETHTGMVAGNVARGLQAWGQGFGVTGTQDDRDGIDGYEIDAIGLAVGADTEMLAEDWVFGTAFSYTSSDVASDNAADTQTDIDTYQATLYANYDFTDRNYVSGQVGYAWSENSSTRRPAPTLSASGDYDSSTFSARLETGRDYKDKRNMTLTPKLIANYMHYDADGYTETGAGGAGLNVASESLQLFELGAALDINWLYQVASGGFIKPAVHVGVRHDFIGDEFQTTSSFTGGGASFETTGFDPAQTTYDAGLGVTYYTTGHWELTADYDYEMKEDYSSHAGVLRAGYRF